MLLSKRVGISLVRAASPELTEPAVPLNEIPYLDFPELRFNEKESTEMPFRYVKGDNGAPVMPQVSTLMPSGTATILT